MRISDWSSDVCSSDLVPVEDADAALQALAEVSVPDATHNCWAWRIGDDYRSNDDGEPAGTAGRPILAAIDGQGMDRVVVVVTRWFGGLKLGAGDRKSTRLNSSH